MSALASRPRLDFNALNSFPISIGVGGKGSGGGIRLIRPMDLGLPDYSHTVSGECVGPSSSHNLVSPRKERNDECKELGGAWAARYKLF